MAPAASAISLTFLCCGLLKDPDEEKRPLRELFTFPTFALFVFWISFAILFIILSFWLFSIVLIGLAGCVIIIGGFYAIVGIERRLEYSFISGPLARDYNIHMTMAHGLGSVLCFLLDSVFLRLTAEFLSIVSVDEPFILSNSGIDQLRILTSDSFLNCGGSGPLFIGLIGGGLCFVLLAMSASDALALVETSLFAIFISRRKWWYTILKISQCILMMFLRLIILTVSSGVYRGSNSIRGSSSWFCEKGTNEVTAYAPYLEGLYGEIVFIVLLGGIISLVGCHIIGHFFQSGMEKKLAIFLRIPSLADKNTSELIDISFEKTVERWAEPERAQSRLRVIPNFLLFLFGGLPALYGGDLGKSFRVSERAKYLGQPFQLPSVPLHVVQYASKEIMSLSLAMLPGGIVISLVIDYITLPPLRSNKYEHQSLRIQQAIEALGAALFIWVCVVGLSTSTMMQRASLIIGMILIPVRALMTTMWINEEPEDSLAPVTAGELADVTERQTVSVGSTRKVLPRLK